jgi:DNA repair protein SbcD/Mre11
MMPRFRFVHAADLHLDTPFACARAESPKIAERLRDATFGAWQQVVAVSIENDAAFVVVAGDVYDASQKSLRAQLRFREGLEQLNRHKIPVFVTHGNHDPLDSVSASVPPPPNTCVFGAEVETREVRRNDQLLARITGISHPQKNESRNLARLFPAPTEGTRDIFELAVLHCNVGAETGHDPYAPCALDDLITAGYNYWALGHVHERRILSRSPWIVYPGNTQGRSLREAGPRGCLLVEVEGSELLGEPKFMGTDVVRWLSAEVPAERFKSTQELIEGLVAECRELQELAEERPVMGRLIVKGRSHLYRELRRTGYLAGLEEEVRSQAAALNPFVELSVLDFAAKPALDLDALQGAPDFLGELLRGAHEFTEQDCRAAWEGLAEDRNLNRFKLRSAIEGLDWKEIALQASHLCADLLSPGDSE